MGVKQPEVSITRSSMHAVLAEARRRRVIRVLDRADEPVDLDELAAAVAARERDASDLVPNVETGRASLYHHHVPKMADYGLVAVDRETGTVSLCDVSLPASQPYI